jgi:hypothetical protein
MWMLIPLPPPVLMAANPHVTTPHPQTVLIGASLAISWSLNTPFALSRALLVFPPASRPSQVRQAQIKALQHVFALDTAEAEAEVEMEVEEGAEMLDGVRMGLWLQKAAMNQVRKIDHQHHHIFIFFLLFIFFYIIPLISSPQPSTLRLLTALPSRAHTRLLDPAVIARLVADLDAAVDNAGDGTGANAGAGGRVGSASVSPVDVDVADVEAGVNTNAHTNANTNTNTNTDSHVQTPFTVNFHGALLNRYVT